MMADIKVEIEGLKELQAALLELPKKTAKNALRSAVNAGASVIRKDARKRAPVYTGPVSAGHPPPGTLKRSVIQKYIRELSNDFQTTFYVTVRKGKKYREQGKKGNLSQDAFYAYFVEYGTAKMTAKPFLRPAFEATKDEALQAMMAKLKERIEQEAGK